MIDGRYTETELLSLFADNGWTRLQFKLIDQGSDTLPEGGTISHWLYRAMQQPSDGCLTTNNFVVLKWPDGTYVFDGKNPFAVKAAPVVDSFSAEVDTFVKSSDLALIRDMKIDSENEIAKLVAVYGTDEKEFIIKRNGNGELEYVSMTSVVESKSVL